MAIPPEQSSGLSSDLVTQIQQEISDNKGQVYGAISGGMVVGNLTVYYSQKPTESETPQTESNKLGHKSLSRVIGISRRR